MIIFVFSFIIYFIQYLRCSNNLKHGQVNYTYGKVVHIQKSTGRYEGSSDIAAITVINGQKFIIYDLFYNQYKFKNTAFYKIEYWCKNANCAKIIWTPNPIDSSTVFNYFKRNGTVFKDSLFSIKLIKILHGSYLPWEIEPYLKKYHIETANTSQGGIFSVFKQTIGLKKRSCSCCN